MSSYYDTFGSGPENYDDDPDGVEAERREVEEDQQRHPERYESRRVLIVPGSRSEQLLHYPALDEAIAEVSERMERDGSAKGVVMNKRCFRLASGPYRFGNIDHIVVIGTDTYSVRHSGERTYCNQTAKDILRDLEHGLYVEIAPPPALADDLAKLQANIRVIRDDYRDHDNSFKMDLDSRLNKIEADIGTMLDRLVRE